MAELGQVAPDRPDLIELADVTQGPGAELEQQALPPGRRLRNPDRETCVSIAAAISTLLGLILPCF